MADEKGSIQGTSDAGVAGQHTLTDPIELFIGPSTADEKNTVRLPLLPIACFRVDDIRFAFDSSFIGADPGDRNDIRSELRLLVQLLKNHPDSPLSVFGHADQQGSDDYNKQLSGRRAIVIYALLIVNGDPATATRLWQDVARQESWGKPQRQTMQSFTGLPAGTADSELFKAYMQRLSPTQLQLKKENFLAQGADAKGKGDYQGCSEFNPLLIFSRKRQTEFDKQTDKTARNDANSPNRRVMVLLFPKGSKVDPAKWPCPRAGEGPAVCRKRFWSDGEKRRATRLPEEDRRYEIKQDTFACRFYHRLLNLSPCEGAFPQIRIRLFDRDAQPLPGAPCLVTLPGKEPRPDRASGTAGPPSPLIPPPSTRSPANATKGSDNNTDGYIIVREEGIPVINVKWSRPKEGDGAGTPLPLVTDQFEFEMDVVIEIQEDEAEKAAMTRLTNLGYVQGPTSPADDIRAFQIEYKARFSDIVIDGTLNEPTRKAIKTVHDAADPVAKGPRNTPV